MILRRLANIDLDQEKESWQSSVAAAAAALEDRPTTLTVNKRFVLGQDKIGGCHYCYSDM